MSKTLACRLAHSPRLSSIALGRQLMKLYSSKRPSAAAKRRFGAVAKMKLRTECNLKEENLMKFYNSLLAIVMLAVVAASGMDRIVDAADAPPPSMGFFVTSAKSKTGNLGGLAGADKICQDLATAVGQGDKTWRASFRVGGPPANHNKSTKCPRPHPH